MRLDKSSGVQFSVSSEPSPAGPERFFSPPSAVEPSPALRAERHISAEPRASLKASLRTLVEVRTLWGDQTLNVCHLDKSEGFSAGEGSEAAPCDVLLPQEKLGSPRLELVSERGGEVLVLVPPGATLALRSRGRASALAHMASTSDDSMAAREQVLEPGMKVVLGVGDFEFHISLVEEAAPMPRTWSMLDRDVMAYFGATCLFVGSLFGILMYLVPPLGLVDDAHERQRKLYMMQSYLTSSAEREREAKQETQEPVQHSGESGGKDGQAAAGDEGSLGKPNSTSSKGRYGVQGPADNSDPHLARTRQMAESFGMIGLLASATGSTNSPIALFGRDTALGADPESAEGNLFGDSIHDAAGVGGLGLLGLGESGGGVGQGIGLSHVGTLGSGTGRCDNGATCSGMGDGFSRTMNGHLTRAITARPAGNTNVSGKLPAEVVQRIIRQNFGRFRMCYEQGLRVNPNLAGRVGVRFVIGQDGRVMNASNGGSDLPDSNVVSCVVNAFYSLSFPAPENGIVTVSYPITFSPG